MHSLLTIHCFPERKTMPQNTPHPWYNSRLAQWTRCRDAMAGSDAVKARGELYLPKPTGMKANEYEAYKIRAKWFNAAKRTREGLTGLVFRHQPTVTAKDAVLAQLADVTETGVSHQGYAQMMMQERLTAGVLGTLVDLTGDDRSINELRAHWTGYTAEQIFNWHWEADADGRHRLTRVVLQEQHERPKSDDEYAIEIVTRYRELVLTSTGYEVLVWEPSATGLALIKVDVRRPTRQGQPLDFLPFVLFQGQEPPLLDVVDVNLNHYQVSADYQHELHWGSVITPVITGWRSKRPEVLALGSLEVLCIPEADARAFMLETSGNGLAAKKLALDDAKQEMAVLGARMLAPDRNAAEATETHALRQAGEHSVLQGYADEVSQHLTQVLRLHSWWIGATQERDDPSLLYTLNKDYLPTGLTGGEMLELMAAFQGGAITEHDLYYNLRQGERLDPGETFEEWQFRRQQQVPL
jgi:hypothetical protein